MATVEINGKIIMRLKLCTICVICLVMNTEFKLLSFHVLMTLYNIIYFTFFNADIKVFLVKNFTDKLIIGCYSFIIKHGVDVLKIENAITWITRWKFYSKLCGINFISVTYFITLLFEWILLNVLNFWRKFFLFCYNKLN